VIAQIIELCRHDGIRLCDPFSFDRGLLFDLFQMEFIFWFADHRIAFAKNAVSCSGCLSSMAARDFEILLFTSGTSSQVAPVMRKILASRGLIWSQF
jgi:hypothetical protein